MKKINLEVLCKRSCFSYWNSCTHLPNFVNVAALERGHKFPCHQNMVVQGKSDKNLKGTVISWDNVQEKSSQVVHSEI